MPCPVSVFSNTEFADAVDSLRSLPEGAAISHRLLPESGVIVVEVKQALARARFRFAGIHSRRLDRSAWRSTRLVIHAREFPGWENLASFFRHMRFIRDHHRKIKRIALAADTKLASLAPSIAEHFIQAEVKSFGYDELTAQSHGQRDLPSEVSMRNDPRHTKQLLQSLWPSSNRMLRAC